MNAVNALCRYYRAMGYYKYTDELDEMIGTACDQKRRQLVYTFSPNFMTQEIKSFLIQHYTSLDFYINIDEIIDFNTGEITGYKCKIRW